MKKGIDKRNTFCYNTQAVLRGRVQRNRTENLGWQEKNDRKKLEKKVLKKFQKVLDKRKRLCYTTKAVAKRRWRERSLKIEQQESTKRI